jgi:hypothetical protein
MKKAKLDLVERPIWEPPELAPAPSLPALRRADDAKSKGWGERARDVLAAASVVSRTPMAELPMTCGVHNRPFIVEAELREDVVVFVRNRLATVGASGGAPAGQESLGQFRRFEARREWSCPHCNTRDNPALGIHLVWVCCGNLMCAGTIERSAYCGCGAFRELHFSKAGASTRWEVHGARASTSPAVPRLAAPANGPWITAGRASPRQITAGGPPLRLPWDR